MNLIQLFSQLLGSGRTELSTANLTNEGKLDDAFSKLLTEKGFDKKDLAKITQLLESQKNERKAFVNKAGIEVSIEYPIHLIKKQKTNFEGLKEQIAKLPNASEIQENGKPLDLPTNTSTVKSPTKVVVPQNESIHALNAKFQILADNHTLKSQPNSTAKDEKSALFIDKSQKNATTANKLVEQLNGASKQVDPNAISSQVSTSRLNANSPLAPTKEAPSSTSDSTKSPSSTVEKSLTPVVTPSLTTGNSVQTKVVEASKLAVINGENDVELKRTSAKTTVKQQAEASKQDAFQHTNASSEPDQTKPTSKKDAALLNDQKIVGKTANWDAKKDQQPSTTVDTSASDITNVPASATAFSAVSTLNLKSEKKDHSPANATVKEAPTHSKQSSTTTVTQDYRLDRLQNAQPSISEPSSNNANRLSTDSDAAAKTSAQKSAEPKELSIATKNSTDLTQKQPAVVEKTSNFENVSDNPSKEFVNSAAAKTNKHINSLADNQVVDTKFQVNRSKVEGNTSESASLTVAKQSKLAQPKVRFISSQNLPDSSNENKPLPKNEKPQIPSADSNKKGIPEVNQAAKSNGQASIWNEKSWDVSPSTSSKFMANEGKNVDFGKLDLKNTAPSTTTSFNETGNKAAISASDERKKSPINQSIIPPISENTAAGSTQKSSAKVMENTVASERTENKPNRSATPLNKNDISSIPAEKIDPIDEKQLPLSSQKSKESVLSNEKINQQNLPNKPSGYSTEKAIHAKVTEVTPPNQTLSKEGETTKTELSPKANLSSQLHKNEMLTEVNGITQEGTQSSKSATPSASTLSWDTNWSNSTSNVAANELNTKKLAVGAGKDSGNKPINTPSNTNINVPEPEPATTVIADSSPQKVELNKPTSDVSISDSELKIKLADIPFSKVKVNKSAIEPDFSTKAEELQTAVKNTTVVERKATDKVDQSVSSSEKIVANSIEQQFLKEETVKIDAKKNDAKQQVNNASAQAQQVELKQELSRVKNERQNTADTTEFETKITSKQQKNDADFQQMNQQNQQKSQQFSSQLNKAVQANMSENSAAFTKDFNQQLDTSAVDLNASLSMANTNRTVKMGKEMDVQKVQETIVNQIRYAENTEWNRQRIVMDDGSSLRFNIRKVGETLQLQLVGPQSELNKMVQLNAVDIKAHLEQQLGLKVDLQFSQSDGNDQQSNQRNESQNLFGSMGGNGNEFANGQNLSNSNDRNAQNANASLNDSIRSTDANQQTDRNQNPIDGWVG